MAAGCEMEPGGIGVEGAASGPVGGNGGDGGKVGGSGSYGRAGHDELRLACLSPLGLCDASWQDEVCGR